jgi:peptidoglycan-associated lipoprotein
MTTIAKGVRAFAALAVAAAATGCAHVSQDDFSAEMERVRTEMAESDEALGTRITANESSIQTVQTRLDRVESELQRLAEEFDATVQRLETALRFAAPVHFAFDDANVRPEDRELLERFSAVVQQHYPGALVTVEGFTDPAGSAAYNLRLGQRRADAVKTVLVDEGSLNGGMVRTVSYGEDTSRLIDPSQSGPGASGMANRRVVLVIDQADAAPQQRVITDASPAMPGR